NPKMMKINTDNSIVHKTNENEKVNRIKIAFNAKTLLLMTILVLIVSGTASGLTLGPLNCTPFPLTFPNGNGGPTPVSCPAFTVPGATLNAATLGYAADYQFGGAGVNTVQTTFTPAGPAGVTWSPLTATTT